MGAEVEAARVRAAEARARQAATDYDARLAAYGPSHQLTVVRGEALAVRQAELAEAREQLRQAERPATVRARDVEPGMMLPTPTAVPGAGSRLRRPRASSQAERWRSTPRTAAPAGSGPGTS